MYTKERQIMVSLVGSVLVLGFYSLYVYYHYLAVDWGLLNDFKFWGRAFLVLIPVAIAAQILIHIAFVIGAAIVTRKEPKTDLEDERDQLIDLKGTKVAHWMFTLGFLAAMGSQAAGMQPWVMFITLIASGFTAEVVSEVVKLCLYRRGF